MHIGVISSSARASFGAFFIEALEKQFDGTASLIPVGPDVTADGFADAIKTSEVVVVLLEGTSQDPWLMVLGAFQQGKHVICMSSEGTTAVALELLGTIPESISFVPRTSPEYLVSEILPQCLEGWGLRDPRQTSLGVPALSDLH